VLDYIRDGADIYARSFATIRAEADLAAVPPDLEKLAVRMIHASGMVDIVSDLAFSPGAGTTGRAALAAGAPILCDSPMVLKGITRARLPADNRAALLDEGLQRDGAVIAIGSDFAVIDAVLADEARPALILAFPAGFEGAAEAKARLAANERGLAFVTLRGTRGGTAMAAAAINALAHERE
jgi:precorrin-8X/cobalt-precorrin-8 methylmutase